MSLEHELRRAIVTLLRDGERSAGDIARSLGRRLPGVSHHLSRLRDANVIQCRRSGAHLFYSLNLPTALAAWNEFLADDDGQSS